MAIELKYKTVNPGDTATFDFSSDDGGDHTVQAYAVGIAFFELSYGDTDHHVQTASVSLSTNKPDATTVTAKVSAKLKDNSGHNLKKSDSSVTVCCIAVTGAADPNTVLNNQYGILSGSQSAGIALPSSNPQVLQAFLSGFDLSFGSNSDHHMQGADAVAGSSLNGSTAYITSEANMWDNSGHNASTATIDGGLIAQTTESGIVIKVKSDEQTSNPVDVDMGQPIDKAVVLLLSWTMQFDSGDHHVKKMLAGCSDWDITGDNNDTVTLDFAHAHLKDNSGNDQNNNKSDVSLVIIGTIPDAGEESPPSLERPRRR